MSDADGQMLSSSSKHAGRLGRPIGGVVGRNWREWALPSDIIRLEQVVARVLSTGPETATMLARRVDGRVTASRLTMTAIRTAAGQPAVLGVHNVIYAPERFPILDVMGPVEIAMFVNSLAVELARMASHTGLYPLSESLEGVAASLGQAIAPLRRRRTS